MLESDDINQLDTLSPSLGVWTLPLIPHKKRWYNLFLLCGNPWVTRAGGRQREVKTSGLYICLEDSSQISFLV